MNLLRSTQDEEVLSQLQQGKEPEEQKKQDVAYFNKFLVGHNCARTKVAILMPPPELISKVDALLLAAYLVKEADKSPDLGAFKSVLLSVQAMG